MDLASVPKKWIVYAAAAVFVLFVVFVYVMPSFQARAINAKFDPTDTIAPGKNTNLVVEVTNLQGRDVSNLTISANATDPAHISVSDGVQSQVNVGNGEMRKFRFLVTAAADTIDGTYSIKVNANFDSKTETQTINIRVEKGKA